MPVWLLLLLLGGAAALLVSSQKHATSTSIVLLGDSLAVGLAPYMEGWAKKNGLSFFSDVKGGRSTRAQGVEVVVPGSVVFVSLGTNDSVAKDIDFVRGKIRERILTLVGRIHGGGAARIIWLLPPATRPLPGLNTVMKAVVDSGVETVSVATELRDGIHPRNYRIVAAAMLDRLLTPMHQAP